MNLFLPFVALTRLFGISFAQVQWVDLGAGCCSDRHDNRLFKGVVDDFDACKEKCLEYGGRCKFVEYGWQDSTFCYVVSDDAACETRRTGDNNCGSSGNDGVHAYEATFYGDGYYVDDGCHNESAYSADIFTGSLGNPQDDVIGFYQNGSFLAGVRCCSDDTQYRTNVHKYFSGTVVVFKEGTCVTPGRCDGEESSDEIGEVTFDEADEKCKSLNTTAANSAIIARRLCTKDELLSEKCCGTGGKCDDFKVWTSTPNMACDPNPCNNDGTCVDVDGDGTPECICEEGYSGDTCDLNDHYTKAINNYGCCTSETSHKRCSCASVTSLAHCKELCTQDTNCKGYFEGTGSQDIWHCNIATTSNCPSGCTGEGWSVGDLNPVCETSSCRNVCSVNSEKNECYIKGTCLAWRHTGNCDGDGPREPSNDKDCATTIEDGWSGYCECIYGSTMMKKGCEHGAHLTCHDACLSGCVVDGVAGDGTAQGTCPTATYVCTAAGTCLGCVVAGVAGDGTTQGTCATATDVCTSAGTCLGTCSAWRHTGNCDGDGPREPLNDKGCATTIEDGWSGYCECIYGSTMMKKGCEQGAYLTCHDACLSV